MANLGGTFDANQVDPQAPFEVIPPGDYKVQIVQSEMRDNKNSQGQHLWMELDIVDGQYAGRKLWDRLNLINQNAQAQEIAQKQLSAICHAVGQLSVSDSEQLHFKPLMAKVKVKPDQNGENRNEISGYKAVDGAQPGPAQGAAQPAQPAQQQKAAASSVPPWKRAS